MEGAVTSGRHTPQTWVWLTASLLSSFLCLPCRKRKIHKYKEAAQAAQNSGLESKQALLTVSEYSPESLQKPEPLPQDERSGEVLVQWKDGTVTTLYKETADDAM